MFNLSFKIICLLLLVLPGLRMARAQASSLADSLGIGRPAPAVVAPSRVVVDLPTATRNAYFMRVPDADHGFLATQLRHQPHWGLYANIQRFW